MRTTHVFIFLAMLSLQIFVGTSGAALVAQWSFNEGSGNTLGDSSGNNNQGMVYGPAWEYDSLTGGALRFDGINDYVLIPHSSSLDVTKKITITAWVYPASMPGVCPHIIGKMVREIQEDWMGSYWLPMNGTADKKWGFAISTNPGAVDHWSSKPAGHEKWNFLTATFDDSLNVIRLYLDENCVTTFNENKDLVSNFYPVYIGRNNNYSGMLYFKGLIGDIRIYNSILSNEEIQDLYYQFVAIPTVLSAVASDGKILQPGIDDDDYVLMTFQEKVDTAKYAINQVTIDTLLPLNNGHTWRSQFGTVGSIVWNPDIKKLLITLSTAIGSPTIAVGDSVCLTKRGNKVAITGSFGGTDILKGEHYNKSNGEFKIIQNTGANTVTFICPSSRSEKSSIVIYSLDGTVIKEFKLQSNSENNKITWDGTDNCRSLIGSGMYIVRFTDTNIYQQKKIFFIN